MSSSFFYSQDHDCPVCSPDLHPTLLSPSLMSSWEEVSSIIDLYWDEEPDSETPMTKKATTGAWSTRLTKGARQGSDSPIPSTPSTPGSPPSLLSSSSSATSSTSSSSSTSSFSSRRTRLKKAIPNMSLRHKPSDKDLAAIGEKPRRQNTNSQPAALDVASTHRRCASPWHAAEIHPYNFFEASLHMGADYSVLKDGWLRLRTKSQHR